jgi:hypothetical protein
VKGTQTAITFPFFLKYLIQFFDFNRHFLKYFFAADNGRNPLAAGRPPAVTLTARPFGTRKNYLPSPAGACPAESTEAGSARFRV